MSALVEKSLLKQLLRSEHLHTASLLAWVETLDALGWRIALNLANTDWHLSEEAKADLADWATKNPGANRGADDLEQFWRQLAPARRFAESVQVRIWLPGAEHSGAKEPRSTGPGPDAVAELTRREREVWHWLREGKTGPEVALILECSPRTVESHVARLYRKLGVHNRTELLGLGRAGSEAGATGGEGQA
jgi:DNA-binding CsgD family transcriptional regulator